MRRHSWGERCGAYNHCLPNGWGNTGVTIGPGAPQSGQNVAGLCWDITDLKDASGNAFSYTTVIKGIAITAGFGVDPLGVHRESAANFG